MELTSFSSWYFQLENVFQWTSTRQRGDKSARKAAFVRNSSLSFRTFRKKSKLPLAICYSGCKRNLDSSKRLKYHVSLSLCFRIFEARSIKQRPSCGVVWKKKKKEKRRKNGTRHQRDLENFIVDISLHLLIRVSFFHAFHCYTI